MKRLKKNWLESRLQNNIFKKLRNIKKSSVQLFMDGYNLFKRMRDYMPAHLFFLTHPEIDCANNISERQLRKFKRKQKQAVVLRSDLGGQHICDALTIIETARMQHQNVYDVAMAAFIK